MKKLTTFLFTLTVFSSFAQDNTAVIPNSDFHKFQFGVNFSPDVCYRALENTDINPLSIWLVDQRNNTEIRKLGFSAGFHVNYNMNQNLGFQVGLGYSNMGYQSKDQSFFFGQNIAGFPTKIKFINYYRYFDIPVKANLIIGKKKARLIASIGLTTHIFISEAVKTITHYSNEKIKNKQTTNNEYNRFNISPTASFGLDYQINSKTNLRIEPTFRYGLLRIIDAPVTGYLYSGGLNVSWLIGL